MSETQLLQSWRLYSGFGSVILTPFAQWELGVTIFSAVLISIGVGVAVYSLLTVGEFCFRFVTMPAKMLHEARTRIDELEAEKHEKAKPLRWAKIINVDLSFIHGLQVKVWLQVRNSGPPTIIEDWRLKVSSRPELVGQESESYFAPDKAHEPLPQGAHREGVVTFVFPIRDRDELISLKTPGSKWVAIFKDVEGTEYETPPWVS